MASQRLIDSTHLHNHKPASEPSKTEHSESPIRISFKDSGEPNHLSNHRTTAGTTRLSVAGELSIANLPQAWQEARAPLLKSRRGQVEIDAAELVCDDSACLAFFAGMRRVVAKGGGELKVSGLKPELQSLVDLATLDDPLAPQLRPPPRLGIVTRVGEKTASALAELYALVAFLGELSAGVAWAVFHPRQMRWRELIGSTEKAGADALLVVLLLGFLIGVMLAFQAAGQTERYGVRTVIPSVVAIAVTRELGPLITSLLLAGRTTSAYAAELGTMKINQELDALRAMGLDPVRFLAVPRVLAVLLVAPLLAMFCNLAGLVGGYTVMADHGFSFVHYIVQAHHSLNLADVFGGLAKTVVGGLIVGAVGCIHGIRAGDGPRAVGQSTTSAVVTAILLIVATDGTFGVIYYYLGI